MFKEEQKLQNFYRVSLCQKYDWKLEQIQAKKCAITMKCNLYHSKVFECITIRLKERKTKISQMRF